MSGDCRLFVALVPPREIQATVHRAAVANLADAEKVRLVSSENLHLTLAFLGRQPAQKVDAIQDALSRSLRPYRQFALQLAGRGRFPHRGRPKTLWPGLQESEDLRQLAHAVRDAMVEFAASLDATRFVAHITVGRNRSNRRVPWGGASPVDGRSWLVEEVLLVESELGHGPPVYRTVARIPLATETDSDAERVGKGEQGS